MLELRLNKLITDAILKDYESQVSRIDEMIKYKTGAGNDYVGWVDWPVNYDQEELKRIKKDAQYVRDNFDVLVVCGIGGSYLGARSALEALNGLKSPDKLEIIFMGQTFSPNYVAQVMNYLKDKNFAINVISKSGTTTETSISFRLLKELLEKKVGKEKARKAIFATTDKEKGALKTLATQEGYATTCWRIWIASGNALPRSTMPNSAAGSLKNRRPMRTTNTVPPPQNSAKSAGPSPGNWKTRSRRRRASSGS